MALGSGSHSGSRPQRQRITSQQTIPTHSASEGSTVASTVGSTTFVARPVSSQAWGQEQGRRGPSKGVTDRRLEPGQRWNVKMIGDRNKANRTHQSMSYRKGRKSHYQLKDDFCLAHDHESNRVEIFKIGKCKELPDGTEQWVDDESRIRYEKMIQLSIASLDSESGSTPISAKEAFVSVMGKDRSGRIRCGGSRETRRTWYETRERSSSSNYQQQISNIENTLRMELEELRTEACRQDSKMDEMRRELEQMRKRESKMDDIRRQMLQMSTFMTQFQTSQGFVSPPPPRAPEDDHLDTDVEGDDYDDDD